MFANCLDNPELCCYLWHCRGSQPTRYTVQLAEQYLLHWVLDLGISYKLSHAALAYRYFWVHTLLIRIPLTYPH